MRAVDLTDHYRVHEDALRGECYLGGTMNCPFCALVSAGDVLVDGGAMVAIADAYPLSPGHALILPRRHEPDFFALRAREIRALARVVAEVRALVIARYRPAGFNLGVNVGAVAGQTVDHAHLHVIPRYEGDVSEPRGGIRWIIPSRAVYWS
jgi:diadenosine tetraphosphate (Ap4A) HIT family hydrolase